MFSDRIENLSRGTIPPGQTMEGFFAGESVPVNQKLSDMLLQLHISERIGRGVPKITEVYGKGTYEFRENRKTGGRNARGLEINRDIGRVIGIYLGLENITISLSDIEGKILKTEKQY